MAHQELQLQQTGEDILLSLLSVLDIDSLFNTYQHQAGTETVSTQRH